VIQKLLFAFALGLVACGGGTPKAEEPEVAETIVVIPEVTEEQSKKAEKEPAAPVGTRDPIAALDLDVPEGSESDMWGGSSAGPRGGYDCNRAANLCLSFYATRSQSSPDIIRICNNLRSAPSSMCTQLYTQFQQVMPGGSGTPTP
jgi:hypothetical protein